MQELDAPSPSAAPRETRIELRLSLDKYGNAIRAAYEAGYLDGFYHPHKRSVTERMRECSAGFWNRVLSGLLDRGFRHAD